MTLSEALVKFVESRAAEGAKDSTLEWYQKRLKRLVKFAGNPGLDAVGVEIIRGFLASLRAQDRRFEDHPYKFTEEGGLSPATIRGYGRALRQFFRFLHEEGMTSENLMARIKLPKNGKRAPKSISFENVQKLLNAVSSSACPERDRALVMFLTDTGCRVGGLIGLTWSDLDLDKREALVTEKGDKSRFVFFSEHAREALRVWRDVWRDWEFASDWVFVSCNTGEQLTVSGVNQLLKRLKKRSGVTGQTNPHAFRHGYAKDYIMAGGDLGTLADLMGHESVETTKSFYAVFEHEDLRRKHDLFSAARWKASAR